LSQRNAVPLLLIGVSDKAEQFIRATCAKLKGAYIQGVRRWLYRGEGI